MRAFFVSFGFAYACIITLVLATGCTLAARSSATVLGPVDSSLVLRRPVHEASIEITNLFAARGYMLIDQQQSDGKQLLRMKGTRRTMVEDWTAYGMGSIFYVFVDPHGEGAAAIMMIGRPTLYGQELCTNDPLPASPCRKVYGNPEYHGSLGGHVEAEVIHGVMSELRLYGEVDEAEISQRRLAYERELCKQDRKQRMARVMGHHDLRVRAQAYNALIKNAPPCD